MNGPRRRPSLARRAALVALALVGLYLVLFVVGFLRNPFRPPPGLGFLTPRGFAAWMGGYEAPGLSEISRVTGLWFPSRTRVVASYLEGWQGLDLYAKLEMERGVAGYWVSCWPGKWGQSAVHRLGMVSRSLDVPWWDPDSAQRFVAARWDSRVTGQATPSGRGFESVGLLVALDDPEVATVYLRFEAD